MLMQASRVEVVSQFRSYLLPQGAGVEEAEAAQPIPSGLGELIMFVDDEEAIRRSTRRLLESKQYRVMEARDGYEALALCRRAGREIRAFIVDMRMPCMDGASLVRELEILCPGTPVIVVSGLFGLNQRFQSAGAAVRACLAKPWTSAQLLTTLRRVLEDGNRGL